MTRQRLSGSTDMETLIKMGLATAQGKITYTEQTMPKIASVGPVTDTSGTLMRGDCGIDRCAPTHLT